MKPNTNGWGQFSQTLPVRLFLWFDRTGFGRALGAIAGLVMLFGLMGGVLYLYVNVSGDTDVLVRDVKGDVHITIPKAPNEGVTSRDIACLGTVLGPLSARMNGYRATYAVRDTRGIVTAYSMVLTLDDRGEPRDAYSLAWEYGDGKVDDRDQITPIFIVTEAETTKCLQVRGQ